MKPINKAMWFELIGGIFGWIWLASIIGTIYFLIRAIFFDGSWMHLLGVMIIGGICKSLLRKFEEKKNLLMAEESVKSQE